MVEKVPKSGERHIFADSRSWAKPKHAKPSNSKIRLTSETKSKGNIWNIKKAMILYPQK